MGVTAIRRVINTGFPHMYSSLCTSKLAVVRGDRFSEVAENIQEAFLHLHLQLNQTKIFKIFQIA
jgi:hypothetical protein